MVRMVKPQKNHKNMIFFYGIEGSVNRNFSGGGINSGQTNCGCTNGCKTQKTKYKANENDNSQGTLINKSSPLVIEAPDSNDC